MKKILILSIISGILLTSGVVYSQKVQRGISSEIIRLHVLANSNSPSDQALKLKVRDRILKEGEHLFENASSKAECSRILNENMPLLQAAAEDEILKGGYSYNAKLSRGNYFFPMKTYENFALPAGEYDALKIEIGNGEGENWWCVMFPPLCFVDAAVDEGFGTLLSEEEMALISSGDGVNIKFKIVDFFQTSINQVKTALKK